MRVRAKYVRIRHASARGVAERWWRMYFKDRDSQWYDDRKRDIWKRLNDAGDAITIDQADEIIGNQSWTHISCDGCNEYVLAAVEIGECNAKAYCPTCIHEAGEILERGE